MYEEALLSVGVIILAGYMGRIAYKRTKLPEVLFMMTIGLLLGPVFHLIDAQDLLPIVPIFSILALLIVLLDCGLTFNIFRIMKRFKNAFIFTITVSVLCTSLIGAALHYIFHWEVLHALLLGLIASGTTTVSAMVLLEPLTASKKIKEIIFIETVINDFTLILGAGILLSLMNGNLQADILPAMLSNISLGLMFGLVTAFLWMTILSKIETNKLNYISSIGVLFMVYGVTEFLHGNGLIAALVLTTIMGNYPNIRKKFIKEEHIVYDPSQAILRSIRHVQEDISFLVKVFFFVVIGAIFDPTVINNTILAIVGLIVLLILISRIVATKILSWLDKTIKKDAFVLVTMFPRGFVATVLAFITLNEGVKIPTLTEIVLILVFVTNLLSILASTYYQRNMPDEGDVCIEEIKQEPKKKTKKID